MKPPVNMEIKKEIAVRLKDVRLELGYNQQQFADTLGVTRQHINRIESINMERMPSRPFLARVSKLAGVNEEWLYSGKGKKYIRDSVIELRANEKAAEISSSLVKQTIDYFYLKTNTILRQGDLTAKQFLTYFQLFSESLEIIFNMMSDLRTTLERNQNPSSILDKYSLEFRNHLTEKVKDFE